MPAAKKTSAPAHRATARPAARTQALPSVAEATPQAKPRAARAVKAQAVGELAAQQPAQASPAPKAPAKRRSGKAAPSPAADDGLDPLARFDFQQDALGYVLRRAQVRTYEVFFEMLGPLELSPARLTALSLVATETNISQATLARRLNVAGPSVLKLIDALEGAGLIERTQVPGDRRRYSLVPTGAGWAMLDTLRVKLAEYEARLSRRLSADERQQLMSLLERVAI